MHTDSKKIHMTHRTFLSILGDALSLPRQERHELARLLAASELEAPSMERFTPQMDPYAGSHSADARVEAKIYGALKAAAPGSLTGVEISKITKNAPRGVRRRTLDHLLDSGAITVKTIQTGGRPRKEYRYVPA